jgi:hypothetical protein
MEDSKANASKELASKKTAKESIYLNLFHTVTRHTTKVTKMKSNFEKRPNSLPPYNIVSFKQTLLKKHPKMRFPCDHLTEF